jgi:hypothetical protein
MRFRIAIVFVGLLLLSPKLLAHNKDCPYRSRIVLRSR